MGNDFRRDHSFRIPRPEEDCGKAVTIDDYLNIARMNLALLLYQKDRVQEAEKLYEEVIEMEPDYGQAYFILDLLFHEPGSDLKSLNSLGKTCELQPVNLSCLL